PKTGLCSTSLVSVLQPVVSKKPEAKDPVNNSLRFSLLFIAGILDIFLFQFTHDIIRCPARKRKDGPGRIFVGLGYKGSTIYHKEVFAFMRQAIAVEHGSRWIVAHPGCPHLMYDPPWSMQPIVGFAPGLLAQEFGSGI